ASGSTSSKVTTASNRSPGCSTCSTQPGTPASAVRVRDTSCIEPSPATSLKFSSWSRTALSELFATWIFTGSRTGPDFLVGCTLAVSSTFSSSRCVTFALDGGGALLVVVGPWKAQPSPATTTSVPSSSRPDGERRTTRRCAAIERGGSSPASRPGPSSARAQPGPRLLDLLQRLLG